MRRQKAVEADTITAREGIKSISSLLVKVLGLEKDLKEMTVNSGKCWAANESYRRQSFDARKAVEASEVARREVERQRDELAKAFGELQATLARMMVERVSDGGSGAINWCN